MCKVLAIGLVVVHLFAYTEAVQVFRLPNLISHFLQHHRQDPEIGFSQFISMHYGGDDGTSADDNADDQLPCHKPNRNTLTVVYVPTDIDIPSLGTEVSLVPRYATVLRRGNLSKHVLKLLQPPRHS